MHGVPKVYSHFLTAHGLFGLLLTATLLLSADQVNAQRAPGDVALGIELGDPSGVTLLFYSPPGPSWDFLAAWDIDDFFFLNVHGLFERPLGDISELHLFYGPGAFVGFREGRGDDDVVIGVSGTVGIGYLVDRFEIYGRVTPRLAVVPDTEGDVGAGLGFRFFF